MVYFKSDFYPIHHKHLYCWEKRRAYEIYLVHLTDPCLEMKPLRDTSQFLGYILTVSGFRAI